MKLLGFLLFITIVSCNDGNNPVTQVAKSVTTENLTGRWLFVRQDIRGFDGLKNYLKTDDFYDISSDSGKAASIMEFKKDSVAYFRDDGFGWKDKFNSRTYGYRLDEKCNLIYWAGSGKEYTEGVLSFRGDTLVLSGTESFGTAWETEEAIYVPYTGVFPILSWMN